MSPIETYSIKVKHVGYLPKGNKNQIKKNQQYLNGSFVMM